MRKILLLLLFVITSGNLLIGQNKLTEKEKTTAFSNVWGLLKYKHPEISKGNYNWNTIFLEHLKSFENIETQIEFNKQLLNWINSYDDSSIKIKKSKDKKDEIVVNPKQYQWITLSEFNTELIQKLTQLSLNTNYKNYYTIINRGNFLSFENENGISNFDYLNKYHRLLLLSNFWNAMYYWNVNINFTEQPWQAILEEMTDDFLNATTLEKFELARLKLISKLNDSHANYGTEYLYNTILNRYPPFGVKIVNDTLVVTNIYNDSLADLNAINTGDIITHIQGLPIKKYYQTKFSNLYSFSNSNYLKHLVESKILCQSNTTNSVKITRISSGKSIEGYQQVYTYKALNFKKKYPNQEDINNLKKEHWHFKTPNIAYVNLKEINADELKQMFLKIENTEGLIIDLRNYPRNFRLNDITKYLYPKRKKFINVLMAKSPGVGIYNAKNTLTSIISPFVTGKNNSDHYKGKIALLVDASTISMAEFMGMAIQQAPNCITVGTQTAGAIMNISEFNMVDNTKIAFTSMAAFYPDGTQAQKNGLKIDYFINESLKDFKTDIYINKAIQLLSNIKNN